MTRGRKPKQKEDAANWLRALLADAPKSVGEIETAYNKECRGRFSWITLKRSKKDAGITSLAEHSRWIWGKEDVIKQMRGVVPAPKKKKEATAAPAPASPSIPAATPAPAPPAAASFGGPIAPSSAIVLSPASLEDRA